MIISGGNLFVFKDDVLPKLSINGTTVIMDVPENSTLEVFENYLNHRATPGSFAEGCNFVSLATWSKQEALKSISRVQSDSRPDAVSLGQRIKAFLGMASE